MGKKNTEKKTNSTPKKERKARVPMRSRKENPAGHFADKLRAYSKQAQAAMAKIETWPGIAEAQEAGGLNAVVERLESLAADKSFTPPRKRGGRVAVSFGPGQKVNVAPECVSMLKTLFVAAGIEGAEFFVSDSYSPQPKDKQLPLRVGGGGLDKPAVGFVNRNFLSPVA